ncbi:hypothetical protein [Oceanisphaera pacifica]|uniref:hypothetical protein n=1 Tax=Oceanisphaera pacifica TaxID=2818389 RepID=UPI00311CA83F
MGDQNNLGTMYANGEGVPQSLKQAYAWWSVAAASGHTKAKKNRDIAAKELTPKSLSEGQALAVEYFEKYSN